MNTHLIEIGRQALLANPHTQLIATVNHFENFKLWATPIIDSAITDELCRTDDFDKLNAYLESGIRERKGYRSYHPEYNPPIIEIAREIHNHFQPKD